MYHKKHIKKIVLFFFFVKFQPRVDKFFALLSFAVRLPEHQFVFIKFAPAVQKAVWPPSI